MKTAIITLDIINEICHNDGKLARYTDRIAKKQVINNINKLTAWGRKHHYLIIHVRIGFNTHYYDGSHCSPIFAAAKKNNILLLNKWGCKFCEGLHRDENDIQIIKHRVSAFYGTDLDLVLRANRIEHLILTGVATNMAVELTAREAHDRDFLVTIATDATECASAEEQAASLKVLSRLTTQHLTNELIQ